MLPPLLTLQLMRFVYDYSSNQRVKINDPVSIPERLNIEAYTDLHLSKRAGEGAAERGNTCEEETRREFAYTYELLGALIHSGTAIGGHYKAYIRRRGGTSAPGTTAAARGV